MEWNWRTWIQCDRKIVTPKQCSEVVETQQMQCCLKQKMCLPYFSEWDECRIFYLFIYSSDIKFDFENTYENTNALE